MKHILQSAAVAALIAGCSPAMAADAAATVTSTSVLKLTVTINAPFSISANPTTPTIGCTAPAGTLVSAITPAGGDGTAVSWALSGDTADFALSGGNLVVGANGINTANCGATQNVTITASQN